MFFVQLLLTKFKIPLNLARRVQVNWNLTAEPNSIHKNKNLSNLSQRVQLNMKCAVKYELVGNFEEAPVQFPPFSPNLVLTLFEIQDFNITKF